MSEPTVTPGDEELALQWAGEDPRGEHDKRARELALEFARVRAEEREACALVAAVVIAKHFDTVRRCGSCGQDHYRRTEMDRCVADTIVAEIRARGSS